MSSINNNINVDLMKKNKFGPKLPSSYDLPNEHDPSNIVVAYWNLFL